MRTVLDTNILISACLKPAGLEAQVTAMALAGSVTACVTDAVWAEYSDVLFRHKFRAVRERATALLAGLEGRVLRVTAGEPMTVALDDDDNRFLECAVAAGAGYLITGNLRHYPEGWTNPRIVNARVFLDGPKDASDPNMAKTKTEFKVEGMAAEGCVRGIENALAAVDGVDYAHVNLGAGKVTVEYRDEAVDVPKLTGTLEALGFHPTRG